MTTTFIGGLVGTAAPHWRLTMPNHPRPHLFWLLPLIGATGLIVLGACTGARAMPEPSPASEEASGHAGHHHHDPGHAHQGHDHGRAGEGAEAAAEGRIGDAFPLASCPVSGEALGAEPVIVVHEGRELRFCCEGCAESFAADPAEYLARIDADIVAQQRPHYPLDVCPVGGALGEMGEPDDYVTGNRLVRLCCAGCRGRVEEDRDAVIERLDDAAKAAQRDAYPLDVCVVSGEGLEDHGGAIEVVVAGRLFKVCCPGCERELRANPARFIEALDAGHPAETPDEGSGE